MTLAGKVLVVMGGTTGLGLSAAKAFVGAGGRVVVVGRNPESVEVAQGILKGDGIALRGDACDPGAAPRAIERAVERFGGFSGYYHVAGGSGRRFGDGPLHDVSERGWEQTLALNLTSVFYSNRAAVRRFLELGKGGTVLNMTSVLGFSPSPQYFATHVYAAAKAGIIGLTRSCAAYYAGENIRFNAVAPALVATPMSERAQGDEQILEFIRTKQPLDGGRIGAASDLDAAAVFFMSDSSRYVTGQVLAVDGGWSVSEGRV